LPVRILGIDCGSERTGFGAIESDGRAHRLLGAGTIVSPSSRSLAERLMVIAAGLRDAIARFEPEAAAVEDVFHAVNTKSALKLAHVRGVALLVVAEAGLACGEYSPLTIKQCVVGYGRAGKPQVQFMVRSLLGDTAPSQADACDALAVAICHATLGRRSSALGAHS
jgi:crossover junction endodeoxyribonuclease RuvC